VWAVSVASGLLSSTHEFVGPAVGGHRGWEFDAGSLLAAGVRVAAPLVAAWLWERVLTAARREHATRTLVELRRDHRLLGVARAALAVRRIEVDRDGPTSRRLRRARRRLDRAHIAALRTVPPGAANLPTWLAAVGAVDILPSATIVKDLDIWTTASQTRQGEPARGPGDRQEWTTSDHVDHQGPAQGGPGWSTEPEPDQRPTQDVGQPSRRGPDSGQPAGSVDQGEPVRGPGEREEWTTPDHVDHPGPVQGGSGWSTEPEPGRRPTQVGVHRAAEPTDEPLASLVLGHPGPVQDQAGPSADPVVRGPVVAAAEAAIRDANVIELWGGGMSQHKIAAQLDISRSTVGRALTRHNASEPVDAEAGPVDHWPTGGGSSLIGPGFRAHLDPVPVHEPVQ
jgi:hypothetical protein